MVVAATRRLRKSDEKTPKRSWMFTGQGLKPQKKQRIGPRPKYAEKEKIATTPKTPAELPWSEMKVM
jgi:hypothetical protein